MIDWRLQCRAIYGRAYPRAIGALREPSWMFFDIFLPLLSISAFIFYYRALGAPAVYEGFVVIGGAMTAFWLSVMWGMATQFYWEKETGNLELYMMAPMSKMSILAGMALGGMFLTSVRAISTIVLGVIIFQVQMQLTSPLLLVFAFIITLIALYGMGMLFSSLYMFWGRGAWHLSNLMQEPIYLVSGFYFPVKQLGFYVAMAASIIPITLGLDSMRQILFGAGANGLLPVVEEIAILCVVAVVFIIAAWYSLRHMEYLGKKEGRLVLRSQ
ncbi:MAG: ABC-2 type transporter [Methanomassiliicoccales archaeon PtaU1.Bin124]|nr:MAG: ABC-2 type transporter [Methanomassiliicoccales archaeon PtaU1.Bin124]